MGRIALAFRAFFRVLFDAQRAQGIRAAIDAAEPPMLPTEPAEKPRPAAKPAEPKPARSDAVTLLATLQREARFIDFVKEPIDGYSDAQIGAAVREVHRGCSQVLERLFDLRPVIAQDEGSDVELSAGVKAERVRLTGNVGDETPDRGRLVHPGWEAGKCELPKWTGSPASARVVTAAEVEVR